MQIYITSYRYKQKIFKHSETPYLVHRPMDTTATANYWTRYSVSMGYSSITVLLYESQPDSTGI